MIDWLLSRLAQNPAAVFWRHELERQFPAELRGALAEGLLRPLPPDLDGTYTEPHTGRTYALVPREGEIEGWDEDDPEALPIRLTPNALGRFTINLPVLVRRFREAHGLDGASGPLHARLHLLGTLDCGEGYSAVGVVLALFPTAEMAMPHLRTLRDTVPARFSRVAALLPSLQLRGDERDLLRAHRVVPVELVGTNPLSFDLRAALRTETDASPVSGAETHATRAVTGHTLADLRKRYAQLPPRGRRPSRIELAADLGVGESTLYRYMQDLGITWADIVAPPKH